MRRAPNVFVPSRVHLLRRPFARAMAKRTRTCASTRKPSASRRETSLLFTMAAAKVRNVIIFRDLALPLYR